MGLVTDLRFLKTLYLFIKQYLIKEYTIVQDNIEVYPIDFYIEIIPFFIPVPGRILKSFKMV